MIVLGALPEPGSDDYLLPCLRSAVNTSAEADRPCDRFFWLAIKKRYGYRLLMAKL